MEFLREQSSLRRYVLREPSSVAAHCFRASSSTRTTRASERYVWWGTRAQARTWMLELLHLRGRIAVAGRRGNQRLWDLADRWYPKTETVPAAEAKRALAEDWFRSLGVRLEKGRWLAHPDADHPAGGSSHHVPVALRPPDPQSRSGPCSVELSVPPRDVRTEGEARVRLLRPADPPRRQHRRVGSSPSSTARRAPCA